MEECLKNLANNILVEMGRRNWSQQMTADFCGLCRNEINKIVARKKDVQLSTLSKISEGLETPIGELISDKRGGMA